LETGGPHGISRTGLRVCRLAVFLLVVLFAQPVALISYLPLAGEASALIKCKAPFSLSFVL
jgi:hypothetical protein